LMTELTGNLLALGRLIATGTSQTMSLGCMRLLVQTLYVDVGPDLLKLCYELESKLDYLSKGNAHKDVAVQSYSEADRLYHEIVEVREKIQKGTFSQPAAVATMAR